MMIDQESALGGRAPSCGSVAWPVNVIVSPTFQVSVASGASTKAVGAELPAEIVMGALILEPPRWSVTLRRTVTVPAVL